LTVLMLMLYYTLVIVNCTPAIISKESCGLLKLTQRIDTVQATQTLTNTAWYVRSSQSLLHTNSISLLHVK